MSAVEATGLGFCALTPVAARSPPAGAASPAPACFAHRILLVEDESAMLQFINMVLIRAGYQVTAVEGSQAAWNALQSRRYDLVITDNRMAGLSGLELIRKLRSAQLTLPVILASGEFDERELTQNQWLQPATVLPKPFSLDALLETVTAALSQAGRDPPQAEGSFSASGDVQSHWGLNE